MFGYLDELQAHLATHPQERPVAHSKARQMLRTIVPPHTTESPS